MYNGAVDDDSDSNHPTPDLQRTPQKQKEVEQDKFKEIQLRFLTFEEKNKQRIEADIKRKNVEEKKNILKWIPCLECCR